MGGKKERQLAFSGSSAVPTNVKREAKVSFLWKRWKEMGDLIQPEQMMRVSPAYDILDRTIPIAYAYRCHIEEKYKGSPPARRHMKNAELLRSDSMLHAVAVIKEIMDRAVENDLPDVLDRALEAAQAIQSCVLESGFFRIPEKPENKPVVKIKRIEPDEEDAKVFAGYMLNDTSLKYNVIINTLAEAARKVGVRLLSVEEMQAGLPPTPVMDLAVSAIN